MVVRFRAGLQLADLKAQLIVARLSGLGDVRSTRPDLDQLADAEQLEEFEVRIETHEDLDRLRAAADVDGVESIEFARHVSRANRARPQSTKRPDTRAVGSDDEPATSTRLAGSDESTAQPSASPTRAPMRRRALSAAAVARS